MARKLILVDDEFEHYICDEYYPEDAGRVHIISEGHYGVFDRVAMTLEFQKAVIDIQEIVFEATDWPEDATDRSINGLWTYFFGDNT